jgi:alpha-beta hydrolase superfamily lysophospholipase
VAIRFAVEGEAIQGDLMRPPRNVAPRGALLLLHGFNSDHTEFGDAPRFLAALGYVVLAFDQRGFGRSDGERGYTSLERALQDVAAAKREVAKAAPGLPIGLLGHSLGGGYAVAALAQDGDFGAAVVAHPVDCLFEELNPIEKLGYHILGKRAMKRVRAGKPAGTIPFKVRYRQLFVDPEAARRAEEDGFLQRKVNLHNYEPARTFHARHFAPQVAQPVLTVVSPHDRVVDPRHSRAVHEALAGPKRLVEHKGGHSCVRDLDGQAVLHAAVTWFDRHLPGAA